MRLVEQRLLALHGGRHLPHPLQPLFGQRRRFGCRDHLAPACRAAARSAAPASRPRSPESSAPSAGPAFRPSFALLPGGVDHEHLAAAAECCAGSCRAPSFRNRATSPGSSAAARPAEPRPRSRTESRVRSTELVHAGGSISRVSSFNASRSARVWACNRSSSSVRAATCKVCAVERRGPLRRRLEARDLGVQLVQVAVVGILGITEGRCPPPAAARRPAPRRNIDRPRVVAPVLRRQHVRRRRQPGTGPRQRRGVRQCVAG